MSSSGTHKAHTPEETHRGTGVVRSAKAIPAMAAKAPSCPAQDAAAPTVSLCTGRCGHCDLHPCQLHAPI